MKDMLFSAIRIVLFLVVFAAAFLATGISWFLLALPIVAVSAPIAIFVRLDLIRTIALAALLGALAWWPLVYLAQKWTGH